MNYELIKVALDGLAFLLSIAAIGTAIIRTRQSKVDERFKAGTDRMDRHDTRLQDLEHTVRSLPSKDDLHALDRSVQRFGAVMEGNQERMGAIGASVQRIEDYLLKSKG